MLWANGPSPSDGLFVQPPWDRRLARVLMLASVGAAAFLIVLAREFRARLG